MVVVAIFVVRGGCGRGITCDYAAVAQSSKGRFEHIAAKEKIIGIVVE